MFNLMVFGDKKKITKCLTIPTKPKEINDEYTHFITLTKVHHHTKFHSKSRNIKENMMKIPKMLSVYGTVTLV